jgi:AraC family transcriptional regulator
VSSTPPGKFFGAIRHRHVATDWVATELHHANPNQFPSHTHRWACLTVLLSGQYAEHDGFRWKAREVNTLVVRPELAPHADRIGPGGARFLTIELNPALLPTLSEQDGVGTDWLVSWSPTLSALAWRIYQELRGAPDSVRLESYVRSLVAELEPDDLVPKRTPGWLPRVLAMLHDQPEARVTIVALAREAGVHPAHLTRAFRRHVGHTVGTYQRNLRLSRAMVRLGDGTDSTAGIASASGFYDQAHLTRTLRAATGMTPTRYRHFARGAA